MALEFNADKERIISSNLEIRNATSFNQILGSGNNAKTAIFGRLTQGVDPLIRVGINTLNPEYELDVNGQIRTTTSIISDTARINNLDVDTIINPFLNLRAPNLTTYTDPETGLTSFPTSATPAFNDDSNKVATTNFVYNIATNDVGGRIYVSEQIGDDTFDGRSATKPVRSIKRAAQLASLTDQKETLIVAGGEYLEDNPISLPPKCSVVGDNIRLVICRPQNPGKHMFKAASENYIFGITFRDQLDQDGNATATWDFAYVFDDKQRIFYDKNLGGEFGRDLPVGYQYFGPQKFLVTFTEATPVLGLVVGLTVTASSGGSGTITEVTFDEDSTTSGNFIIENITGSIDLEDTLTYDDNGTQRSVIADELTSLRAEGEVVRTATNHTNYIILSIQASDNYPDGLIFEVNQYHDYEAGQYVDITNLPNSGTWADLNRFNGRQKITHRIETADGFSTKFVVYKDVPTDILAINNGTSSFYNPTNASVTSSDNYVVLSLLNSPNKFDSAQPNSFRYQDAVDLIQRNKKFISEEALGYVQAQYPSTTFDTEKCKRDIQHIINHISHDLFYGGNAATIEAGAAYLSGGQIGFVNDELAETRYGFEKTRDLCILAARNWNTGTGAYSEPDYAPQYSGTALYKDSTIIEDTTTPTCSNVVSSITTLFQIVDDILNGNALPAATYPTSYMLDQDGKVITIIDPWDDLPIIEVSPYIFNSSVISFKGGGGCLIDGTKVATPNIARPNIPEQGKSMVAAAFTIISFGGIGYKIVEDGYSQLVSCFVIFTQDGVLCETGGYASITNSATNFGTYALRADGFRREPYSFHRGTIRDDSDPNNIGITFDENGVPTFIVEGLGGAPLEHYIVKIGGITNCSEDNFGNLVPDTSREYFIDDVIAVTTGEVKSAQFKLNDKLEISGNTNRFNDAYNLLYNNAEYIGDEAVGIIQNYSTLATAYGSGNEYEVGDIVSFQGDYFICVKYLINSPITLNGTGEIFFQKIVDSSDNIIFQSDVEKCRRDTKLMVESWASDLLNDSNSNTWDAAKLYIDGVNGGVIHITGYEDATKRVFGAASLLAKFAINNLLRKSGTTLDTQEIRNGNYIARYTTETPYRDLTIVNSNDDGDTNNFTTADCSDVQSAIDSLYGLVEAILVEKEDTLGLTRNNGAFTLNVLNRDKLYGKDIWFLRPSIVNSSSHTWEYAGSGNDYNALPQNGGQTGSTETKDFEQVSQNYGRVYASGTDELGDFKVGYFAKVENRTGNITFGGTVEISEVSFLKISGGDITIEGFSADNTLGGIFPRDEILPTQKAVKDFITNNLGNFINKSYSTNPTPRALVELGDNGRINIDQLPALRPFNVFTVADETERLALEGPLAGDIAIQQDNSLSYILNNDLEFQILEFAPNANYVYAVNDIITATPSTAQAQVTQYIHGYIDNIFLADPGSGYTSAPTVLIGRQMPQNSTVYAGEQVSNGNNVYTITNVVDLSLTTPTAPTHTFGPTTSVTSDSIEYTWIGGSWTTATAYQVGDYVVNSSDKVYQITAIDTQTGAAEPTHTSGSTTIDGFTYLYVGTAWSATATYEGGEIVGNSGNAYSLKVSLTTGTVSPTHGTGTVTLNGVDYTYAGVRATATASIANGRVSTITITNAGTGYISDPEVIFDNTGTNGSAAEATAIARSRLYVTILNNIKVNAGDFIEDFTSPDPYHVTIIEVINTSAQNANNWVQLTSSNIDAGFITSGIINTSRLAEADTNYPANSTTFLRGDQRYAPVVQSLTIADAETPIVLASDFTRSTFIDNARIIDGGTEYVVGTYTDQNLFGGDGTGAKAVISVANGVVRFITVTNGGGGYQEPPTVTFEDANQNPIASVKAVAILTGTVVTAIQIIEGGSGFSTPPLVVINDPLGQGAGATATTTLGNGTITRVVITDGGLNYTQSYNVTPLPSAISSTQGGTGIDAQLTAIRATRNLNFNEVEIDIKRINGNTANSNPYSTVGVARFKKSVTVGGRTGQFIFGSDGAVEIDQGIGSGLNADKLDNQEGIFYLTGSNFIDFSITPTKLSSDTYSIDITGSSGTSGLLEISDTRTIVTQPQASPTGLQLSWKQNTTRDQASQSFLSVTNDEIPLILNDGGTLHSTLSIRRSGASATDFSGGAVNSLAFTDNNEIYVRGSGGNFVSALTLVDGGNGYIPGTYSNVPLGGGEGSGLTADIVVNNLGKISSVQLINTGHNYNRFGGAGTTFNAILPENYLGLDNGRLRYDPWEPNQTYTQGTIIYVGNTGARGFIYEVITAGTSGTDNNDAPSHEVGDSTAPNGTAVYRFIGYTNARITATIATTTSGKWQSWQKIWHEGNDGPNSGLNADLLDNRQLSWILRADSNNKGTLNNRRLPENLSAKQFTNSIIVNTVDPLEQSINKGAFFDFYIDGFVDTGIISGIDTQTGTAGTQLNLYDLDGNSQGTVTVKEVIINNDEAEIYWESNIAIPDNRIVQYGYNLYTSTVAISDTGVTPPTHPTGTQNNLEFLRKVQNPSTIITAELISSGEIGDVPIKIGIADSPATYYNIYDWGINKDPKWNINKHELSVDGSSNPIYRMGNDSQISSPQIIFHSSAQQNAFDVKLTVSGGTSTAGQGTLNIQANTAQVNGNTIWHGGNVNFNNGFSTSSAWAASTAYGLAQTVTVEGRVYTVTVAGTSGTVAPTATSGNETLNGVTYSYVGINTYNSTNGNSRAVIRDSNGNFAANRIRADLTGIASGNLPLTGGTLTGTLNINSTNAIDIKSGNSNIKFAGGLDFVGTGDDYNARFASSSEDTETQLLGVYSGNFATERFGVYANGITTLDTADNRLTISSTVWDNDDGSGVIISNSNSVGSGITLIPSSSTATNGDKGWAWYAGAADSVIGDGNFGIWAHGTNIAPLALDRSGNFLIGLVSSTNRPTNTYKLRVDGAFAATSKSFVIDHPTKENYQLVYGSLEGPEHGVYVRGKVTDGVIELPDYWTALVDEDTITVQLTAIGDSGNRWVIDVADNKIMTGGGAAFYFVQAERKDIDKLEVEVEMPVTEEEEE